MKNRKNIKYILVMTMLAGGLSGCGGQSYYTVPNTTAPKAVAAPPVSLNIPTTTPSTSPSTLPTTTPSSSPSLPDPYSANFEIAGTRPSPSTTFPVSATFGPVNTDNILKVRVLASPSVKVEGTGVIFYSSCFQFSVTVGSTSKTVTVNALTQDGTGQCSSTITANPVADFTGMLTPGHGPIQVTVSSASVFSQNYYGTWGFVPMYYTYHATGTVYVSTNGTK